MWRKHVLTFVELEDTSIEFANGLLHIFVCKSQVAFRILHVSLLAEFYLVKTCLIIQIN